jgi:hypothetical protein
MCEVFRIWENGAFYGYRWPRCQQVTVTGDHHCSRTTEANGTYLILLWPGHWGECHGTKIGSVTLPDLVNKGYYCPGDQGYCYPNQVNWAENWRFRNSTGMDGKWNKYNTTARISIEKQNNTVLMCEVFCDWLNTANSNSVYCYCPSARFFVTGCDNAAPPLICEVFVTCHKKQFSAGKCFRYIPGTEQNLPN